MHSLITDVIIVGGGAAGLMCAMTAGEGGKSVILVEHTAKIGEKIRISGGGRCNFTNLYTTPANFISQNKNFCISALKKYTQHDFITLITKHKIKYHEKTLGQLFCDESATQIIDMFVKECVKNNVQIKTSHLVQAIEKIGDNFELTINDKKYLTKKVVIATGGLSIPKIGASDFGYKIARQFGHKVVQPRPALVPLTLDESTLNITKQLAGVAQNCVATFDKTNFSEAMLFTHRGLSGPAILQISSYWQQGKEIYLNLSPKTQIFEAIVQAKKDKPKQQIQTVLANFLPKKLSDYITEQSGCEGFIADLSNAKIKEVSQMVNNFKIKPNGTEGFAKAEVTIGGVDTDFVSSKTFQSTKVKGLYFIGEVLDITGHLGGFNFQWAWSSGLAAAKGFQDE